MNYLKIFSVVLILGLLIGCGDKKEDSQTKNETKKTETTPTVKQYFTVTSVESPSGKGESPNFTWDENGKKMSMKDLKGKIVLINLWATWCGPCKKEIPDLITINNELKDKNFAMLGIQIFQRSGQQSLDDFLKTTPLSYTVLDGNQELVNAFNTALGKQIEGIPTTIIVNGEGKVVEDVIGTRDKAGFMALINKHLK
jgi:thiol-disulfide isomerase/thioredoxin